MKPYALKVELKGRAYPDVLERTRKALAAQGFGIPTEMDTQALFKQKLGKDTPARVILGACLAPVAYEALAQAPDLSVLLPCNVVVRELPGGCEVAAVSPNALFTLVEGLDPSFPESIEAKLRKVLQEVKGAPEA